MKNLKIIFGTISVFAVAIFAVGCNGDSRFDSINVENEIKPFAASGGTQSVKLYFTQDWTSSISKAENEDVWLTVTPSSGTVKKPNIMDSVVVTITAAPYTGLKDRATALTFSTDRALSTVPVKQSAVVAN